MWISEEQLCVFENEKKACGECGTYPYLSPQYLGINSHWLYKHNINLTLINTLWTSLKLQAKQLWNIVEIAVINSGKQILQLSY